MGASAQQQESCVSILSALPSPLEAKPPDSRQFHDCVLPPPPQFFFFENSRAAWTWRGVGDRILHKLRRQTV